MQDFKPKHRTSQHKSSEPSIMESVFEVLILLGISVAVGLFLTGLYTIINLWN